MDSAKIEKLITELPLKRIAVASIVATILLSTVIAGPTHFPLPVPIMPFVCILIGEGEAASIWVALAFAVLVGLTPTLLLICSLRASRGKRKAQFIVASLAVAAAISAVLTLYEPGIVAYAFIDGGSLGAGVLGCLLYAGALACSYKCLFSKSANAPLFLMGYALITLLSVVAFALGIAPFGCNLHPLRYGDIWVGLEERHFWDFISSLSFWIACGATTALALLAQRGIQPHQKKKNLQIGDATNQVKELKELLDEGAITQEEFDAKKKSLLEL